MENDELKSLFDDFQPRLPSEADFMSRLTRNLDAVEMVRSHNVSVNRAHRRAALYAAIAGFVVGILFSLAIPTISSWIHSLRLPEFQLFYHDAPDLLLTAVWIVIGSVSLVTALNTYEISVRLMERHEPQA